VIEQIRYLIQTILTGPCLIGRHRLMLEPTQKALGVTHPGFEYCPRCGKTRDLATEPPYAHPDSLDGLLPDADETWLAEMDALTWPDDTDWQHTRDASARLARSTED
jgi:hypothetical protein